MIALTHAMVLAAGLGTRMRPLTDDRPKPLLELDGRSLLDHALDRLQAAGVSRAVVNAHWFGAQIATALARVSRLGLMPGSATTEASTLPLLSMLLVDFWLAETFSTICTVSVSPRWRAR